MFQVIMISQFLKWIQNIKHRLFSKNNYGLETIHFYTFFTALLREFLFNILKAFNLIFKYF